MFEVIGYTGTEHYVDLHGCLSDDILQKCLLQVQKPLSSAVLGPNSTIFGYCNKSKTLQQYHIPEGTGSSKTDIVQLTPQQEVKGHPLGPASLLLSPHQLWLASVGKDGLLCIRETSSLDKYLQIQCHTCWLGGVRTVSFCADSQTLITTGLNDGSMVCTQLRIETDGSNKANEATQYGQSMLAELEKLQSSENPILNQLPEWNPPRTGSALEHSEETSEKKWRVDVTEQDESYS
ncbi:hypothetical protein JZ751_027302, partial [Albula glossodonta]